LSSGKQKTNKRESDTKNSERKAVRERVKEIKFEKK
jgi:hypothetical protein